MSDDDASALTVARALVALQDRRMRSFRPGLFADPAWDMLLDLYIARADGRSICVGSLSIASRVPAATAHRWIKELEAGGEIVRRPDPLDGRRILIEITDAACRAMTGALLDLHSRRSAASATAQIG
jgi:DNA-binding MarR family transcriptional regulator